MRPHLDKGVKLENKRASREYVSKQTPQLCANQSKWETNTKTWN